MNSTGIVRKIDDLGRIVLPKELRKTLGIDERDPMEIFVENGFILLMKHEPTCVFCGSSDSLHSHRGKNICAKCTASVKR